MGLVQFLVTLANSQEEEQPTNWVLYDDETPLFYDDDSNVIYVE